MHSLCDKKQSPNQPDNVTSMPDKIKHDLSATATSDNKSTSVPFRKLMEIARACLIAASVLAVLIIFAGDIDGMATGKIDITYSLGCSLVSYSAGFIRRGLLGEIIQHMDVLFQPFLSITILASVSLLFILWVILAGMIRLRIKLPYILAVIFSPSLIMMQRGGNFIHNDALLVALNLAASCLLARLLFYRAQKSPEKTSFPRMLALDFVILVPLTASALIHELSSTLLPPVMLLFLAYARKVHRTMHAAAVSVLLIILYAVMMTCFKYADPDAIAESWTGIYTDSDSFRYNTALLNTADKVHALNCLEMTLTLLKECALAYIPQLLLAVAVPFALLLSGITIFHSSSSRAMKARCLLILSCLCPLGLCIAGGDFGRWFSICAINLTAYSLLIAHPAGRTEADGRSSEKDRMVRSIMKQSAAIIIAVVLLNFRLDVNGYFSESEQPFSEEAKETAANASNLIRDLKPLITREIVLQPQNGAKRFD